MHISPYLIFNGNCAEAMNFYNSVFGGELTLKSYNESPEEVPEDKKDQIEHALLIFNDIEIMASDTLDEKQIVSGTSISLSLDYEDIEEAERVFIELSNGGFIHSDSKKTFWGSKLGVVTDRFGIQWMITL